MFGKRKIAFVTRSWPDWPRHHDPNAGINDERTKRSVLIEEGLSNLAVAAHPDSGVSLPRVGEHPARSLAITWSGAINEHHCVKATDLSLFEMVGKGLARRGGADVHSADGTG